MRAGAASARMPSSNHTLWFGLGYGETFRFADGT